MPRHILSWDQCPTTLFCQHPTFTESRPHLLPVLCCVTFEICVVVVLVFGLNRGDETWGNIFRANKSHDVATHIKALCDHPSPPWHSRWWRSSASRSLRCFLDSIGRDILRYYNLTDLIDLMVGWTVAEIYIHALHNDLQRLQRWLQLWGWVNRQIDVRVNRHRNDVQVHYNTTQRLQVHHWRLVYRFFAPKSPHPSFFTR